MSKPINKKQIQLIHIAKADLGLGDEEYRALLMERYPGCFTGSSKELTYEEATDLINHFKEMGFKVKARRPSRRPPNVAEMIYPGHPMMLKIEHLKKDIRWQFQDGYERFIRKFLKKDRIATTKEAAKVMEALKAMKARQQRAAASGGAKGMKHDGAMRGGRLSW